MNSYALHNVLTKRYSASSESLKSLIKSISLFKNAQGNITLGAIMILRDRFIHPKGLFSFNSCYAWENLTLDGLEQSTTTSRDVRYLVGQTELVDTSYRVATTDQ